MKPKGLPEGATEGAHVARLWPEWMDKDMASAYLGNALKPKTLMNYRHLGILGKYYVHGTRNVVFKRTELDSLIVCETSPVPGVSTRVSD